MIIALNNSPIFQEVIFSQAYDHMKTVWPISHLYAFVSSKITSREPVCPSMCINNRLPFDIPIN